MVAVPVLSPCSELERAEPPDVLAGIDSFRKSRLQMQKTVHYGLHVKAIDKADGAKPGSLTTSFKGVKLYSVPQNGNLLTGTFATKTAVDVRNAALEAGYLKDKVNPSAIIQPAFVEAANQR